MTLQVLVIVDLVDFVQRRLCCLMYFSFSSKRKFVLFHFFFEKKFIKRRACALLTKAQPEFQGNIYITVLLPTMCFSRDGGYQRWFEADVVDSVDLKKIEMIVDVVALILFTLFFPRPEYSFLPLFK